MTHLIDNSMESILSSVPPSSIYRINDWGVHFVWAMTFAQRLNNTTWIFTLSVSTRNYWLYKYRWQQTVQTRKSPNNRCFTIWTARRSDQAKKDRFELCSFQPDLVSVHRCSSLFYGKFLIRLVCLTHSFLPLQQLGSNFLRLKCFKANVWEIYLEVYAHMAQAGFLKNDFSCLLLFYQENYPWVPIQPHTLAKGV